MKIALAAAVAACAGVAGAQTLFFSDFEANDGGLSGTGDWEYGMPNGFAGADFGGPEPIGGFSGDMAWGTVIGGQHNPDTVSELKVGTYDLSLLTSFSFYEYSESGGNTFDMAEVLVGGNQVYLSDGSSGLDWRFVEIDLSGLSGTGDITFRFTTTGVVERVGWYIDDVTVSGVPAPATAALIGLAGITARRRR